MPKTLINFVHANGFPAGSYQTFMNYFSSNFKIISLEKYGHNIKYPVENNWQPLVDELIDFVKKQLLESNEDKVICIGHSFGGVISFIAACQRPELFKGLIMLDPPVVTGSTAFAMKLIKKTKLIDKFSPAGKAKVRRTHWPLGSDIKKLFAHRSLFKNFDSRCLTDYITSGITEQNNQLELSFSAQVEADIFRNLAENLSSYKNKLTIPAYLIYGEDSTVLPHKFFKKFTKLNEKISLKMTTGGHMFPLEQPEKTANLINELISSW